MARSHLGLTDFQVARLRQHLRRRCCSEPWVEVQIRDDFVIGPTGRVFSLTYFDNSVFPPGKQRSLMRWCRSCGRFTPPQCLTVVETQPGIHGSVAQATLVCDDCRAGDESALQREIREAGIFPTRVSIGSVLDRAASLRRNKPRF